MLDCTINTSLHLFIHLLILKFPYFFDVFILSRVLKKDPPVNIASLLGMRSREVMSPPLAPPPNSVTLPQLLTVRSWIPVHWRTVVVIMNTS